MSNLSTNQERSPKEDYNNIPVHYCRECLSLKVMRVAGIEDAAYCEDCGCTNTCEASIEEWDNLYKAKNGFSFLEREF